MDASSSDAFQQFLDFITVALEGENPKLIELVQKRYEECDEDFRNSPKMLALLEQTRRLMETEKARMFVHLKDFVNELKARPRSKKIKRAAERAGPSSVQASSLVTTGGDGSSKFNSEKTGESDAEASTSKQSVSKTEKQSVVVLSTGDYDEQKGPACSRKTSETPELVPPKSDMPSKDAGPSSADEFETPTSLGKLKEEPMSWCPAPGRSAESPTPASLSLDSGRDKKKQKHVKKLEDLLESLRNEIEKAQERELSLEDMEAEDSSYIYEDKLKKKFVAAWTKLCEITGRTVTTGRPTEKSIRYKGTRYKEINRRLEKFLNKRKVFPDFHDVKAVIASCNKKYKLHMSGPHINDVAREAFVDIGEELQKRRHEDFIATLGNRRTDALRFSSGPDPYLCDARLRQKLDANRRVGKSNLDHVIAKYTKLQNQIGTSDLEDDDDDDEEEEASGESQCRGDMESGRGDASDEEGVTIEVDVAQGSDDDNEDIIKASGRRTLSDLYPSSPHKTKGAGQNDVGVDMEDGEEAISTSPDKVCHRNIYSSHPVGKRSVPSFLHRSLAVNPYLHPAGGHLDSGKEEGPSKRRVQLKSVVSSDSKQPNDENTPSVSDATADKNVLHHSRTTEENENDSDDNSDESSASSEKGDDDEEEEEDCDVLVVPSDSESEASTCPSPVSVIALSSSEDEADDDAPSVSRTSGQPKKTLFSQGNLLIKKELPDSAAGDKVDDSRTGKHVASNVSPQDSKEKHLRAKSSRYYIDVVLDTDNVERSIPSSTHENNDKAVKSDRKFQGKEGDNNHSACGKFREVGKCTSDIGPSYSPTTCDEDSSIQNQERDAGGVGSDENIGGGEGQFVGAVKSVDRSIHENFDECRERGAGEVCVDNSHEVGCSEASDNGPVLVLGSVVGGQEMEEDSPDSVRKRREGDKEKAGDNHGNKVMILEDEAVVERESGSEALMTSEHNLTEGDVDKAKSSFEVEETGKVSSLRPLEEHSDSEGKEGEENVVSKKSKGKEMEEDDIPMEADGQCHDEDQLVAAVVSQTDDFSSPSPVPFDFFDGNSCEVPEKSQCEDRVGDVSASVLCCEAVPASPTGSCSRSDKANENREKEIGGRDVAEASVKECRAEKVQEGCTENNHEPEEVTDIGKDTACETPGHNDNHDQPSRGGDKMREGSVESKVQYHALESDESAVCQRVDNGDDTSSQDTVAGSVLVTTSKTTQFQSLAATSQDVLAKTAEAEDSCPLQNGESVDSISTKIVDSVDDKLLKPVKCEINVSSGGQSRLCLDDEDDDDDDDDVMIISQETESRQTTEEKSSGTKCVFGSTVPNKGRGMETDYKKEKSADVGDRSDKGNKKSSSDSDGNDSDDVTIVEVASSYKGCSVAHSASQSVSGSRNAIGTASSKETVHVIKSSPKTKEYEGKSVSMVTEQLPISSSSVSCDNVTERGGAADRKTQSVEEVEIIEQISPTDKDKLQHLSPESRSSSKELGCKSPEVYEVPDDNTSDEKVNDKATMKLSSELRKENVDKCEEAYGVLHHTEKDGIQEENRCSEMSKEDDGLSVLVSACKVKQNKLEDCLQKEEIGSSGKFDKGKEKVAGHSKPTESNKNRSFLESPDGKSTKFKSPDVCELLDDDDDDADAEEDGKKVNDSVKAQVSFDSGKEDVELSVLAKSPDVSEVIDDNTEEVERVDDDDITFVKTCLGSANKSPLSVNTDVSEVKKNVGKEVGSGKMESKGELEMKLTHSKSDGTHEGVVERIETDDGGRDGEAAGSQVAMLLKLSAVSKVGENDAIDAVAEKGKDTVKKSQGEQNTGEERTFVLDVVISGHSESGEKKEESSVCQENDIVAGDAGVCDDVVDEPENKNPKIEKTAPSSPCPVEFLFQESSASDVIVCEEGSVETNPDNEKNKREGSGKERIDIRDTVNEAPSDDKLGMNVKKDKEKELNDDGLSDGEAADSGSLTRKRKNDEKEWVCDDSDDGDDCKVEKVTSEGKPFNKGTNVEEELDNDDDKTDEGTSENKQWSKQRKNYDSRKEQNDDDDDDVIAIGEEPGPPNKARKVDSTQVNSIVTDAFIDNVAREVLSKTSGTSASKPPAFLPGTSHLHRGSYHSRPSLISSGPQVRPKVETSHVPQSHVPQSPYTNNWQQKRQNRHHMPNMSHLPTPQPRRVSGLSPHFGNKRQSLVNPRDSFISKPSIHRGQFEGESRSHNVRDRKSFQNSPTGGLKIASVVSLSQPGCSSRADVRPSRDYTHNIRKGPVPGSHHSRGSFNNKVPQMSVPGSSHRHMDRRFDVPGSRPSHTHMPQSSSLPSPRSKTHVVKTPDFSHKRKSFDGAEIVLDDSDEEDSRKRNKKQKVSSGPVVQSVKSLAPPNPHRSDNSRDGNVPKKGNKFPSSFAGAAAGKKTSDVIELSDSE
ncbi:uncharacterized protein LOC101845720 isoform X2 [Aplysia californica]|uniref:Uncharacterized protein LOC101845720 isoform X2 n=1 Tax=Aplysia californica TaxID=6500 RepID=A0ABM0K3F0_APLCA|nr:uncharacterized protein LOC101845720 isoform X2 [Aplysia californica]